MLSYFKRSMHLLFLLATVLAMICYDRSHTWTHLQSINGTSWHIALKHPTGQGRELDVTLSHGSWLKYHLIRCVHRVTCNMSSMGSWAIKVHPKWGCDCMAALDKCHEGERYSACQIPHKLSLFGPCLTKYVHLCVCVAAAGHIPRIFLPVLLCSLCMAIWKTTQYT